MIQHRHCERSEAIHGSTKRNWIASSLALLAMTVKGCAADLPDEAGQELGFFES
jgi:hypothetical protein